MNFADIKDVAGIASAIFSPFIAAWVAIWTYRSQSKERMAIQLVWGTAQGLDGQPEEQPYLYVQNLSEKPIAVVEVNYLRGSFWRERVKGTALDYVDPFFDIEFPYEIEVGKAHRFKIDSYKAKAITDAATASQRLFHRTGRSPVWLEIKTMANSRKKLPAWDATPWEGRAEWLKR